MRAFVLSVAARLGERPAATSSPKTSASSGIAAVRYLHAFDIGAFCAALPPLPGACNSLASLALSLQTPGGVSKETLGQKHGRRLLA